MTGGVETMSGSDRRRNSEVDEAAILARVRGGDSTAYGELVLGDAPVAKRTAVFLGAGSEADDVVQESFVKAYRALGSFRSGSAFRPWLLRIVANETRNLVRSRSRRSRREELADSRSRAGPG